MGDQHPTLVIAPHMDDEALSCGALIVDRVARGVPVHVLFMHGRKYEYGLTTQDETEEKCAWEAKRVLRYGWMHGPRDLLEEGEPGRVGYYAALKKIETCLALVKPTEVVVPSNKDMNQDHKFLHQACKIALRPANLGRVKTILESRSFDTQLTRPNYYVSFDEDTLDRKLLAISKYSAEAREGFHPRAPATIKAVHTVLGSYCGAKYAEGFDLQFNKD